MDGKKIRKKRYQNKKSAEDNKYLSRKECNELYRLILEQKSFEITFLELDRLERKIRRTANRMKIKENTDKIIEFIKEIQDYLKKRECQRIIQIKHSPYVHSNHSINAG